MFFPHNRITRVYLTRRRNVSNQKPHSARLLFAHSGGSVPAASWYPEKRPAAQHVLHLTEVASSNVLALAKGPTFPFGAKEFECCAVGQYIFQNGTIEFDAVPLSGVTE